MYSIQKQLFFFKRKCKSRITAASGKVSFALTLPKGEYILTEF